jgi:hypothetical protein
MSDATNFTRFRCPQCRSRSMLDIAREPGPHLCPNCGVELEPIGRAVDPSAVTREIKPAEDAPPPQPALPARSTELPAAEQLRPLSQSGEIDYLRKIHFWARLIGVAALTGLALGAWAILFE